MAGVNITSNCVHPGGMVRTASGLVRGPKYCWIHYFEPIFMHLFVCPPSLHCSLAPRFV
jgi:hypothetical protein